MTIRPSLGVDLSHHPAAPEPYGREGPVTLRPRDVVTCGLRLSYFCGSEQCTDDLGCFTVTGRATGVDATCTLALLHQALKTNAPDLPITEEQIMLVDLVAASAGGCSFYIYV